MIRLLALACALLAVPAASAQTPRVDSGVVDSSATRQRLPTPLPSRVELSPRPAPLSQSSRRRGQTFAAAGLGTIAGFTAASAVVYAVRPGALLDGGSERELAASMLTGMAVGAAAGASLDRDGGRSFLRSLGGAALGHLVGAGVGALVQGATGSDVGYIVGLPAGAAAGATLGGR